MDFDLTDEQQLIRETARDFTDNEIVDRGARERPQRALRPRARREDRRAGLPRRDRPARVRRRRPRLPHLRADRRGGRARRLGDAHRRSPCRPRSCARRSSLGHRGAEAAATCPSCARASGSGCFGLTEPDTGSDAANQKTRATKTDDGWVINGAKMWISMGNHAKVALIFAQTDPELGHRGIACFLVETDQAGFQPQAIHRKMGLHGSDTAVDRARRRRGRPTTACSARSATASRSR